MKLLNEPLVTVANFFRELTLASLCSVIAAAFVSNSVLFPSKSNSKRVLQTNRLFVGKVTSYLPIVG